MDGYIDLEDKVFKVFKLKGYIVNSNLGYKSYFYIF